MAVTLQNRSVTLQACPEEPSTEMRFSPVESHQLPNAKHVDELYGPGGNRIELIEPAKAGDTSDTGA